MRPSGKWIVERNDIARLHIDLAKRSGDCHWHGTEMDRHVITLSNHPTV
jgi:hypothetical protein